jgi:hypothetical protein
MTADIRQLKPDNSRHPKDLRRMMIADITLAAFTFCNSLRFAAYVPQITRAIRDQSGAEIISFGTWSLFLISDASTMAYALVNNEDWGLAFMFLGNVIGCSAILFIADWKRSPIATGRHWGCRYPPFPEHSKTVRARAGASATCAVPTT